MTPLSHDYPTLPSAGKTRSREVVDTILYHARAFNSPILPALNTIGFEQAIVAETLQIQQHNYYNIVQRILTLPSASSKVTRFYAVTATLHIYAFRKVGLELLRDIFISLQPQHHS